MLNASGKLLFRMCGVALKANLLKHYEHSSKVSEWTSSICHGLHIDVFLTSDNKRLAGCPDWAFGLLWVTLWERGRLPSACGAEERSMPARVADAFRRARKECVRRRARRTRVFVL